VTHIEPPPTSRRPGSPTRGAWALLALAVLCGWGCGSTPDGFDRTAVDGVVKLDGKDLDTGRVLFIPLKVGATASGSIAGGRFQIPLSEGPSPGPYRVEVYSTQSTGRKIPSADDPRELVDETTNIVPQRYNVQSELKVDLPPGGPPEPLTFELVTQDKKPSRR
jgi:hypothetical protein